MPRYNGTGPLGSGHGTSWGLGPCGAGMAYGRRGGDVAEDWVGKDFGDIILLSPPLKKKKQKCFQKKQKF